MNNNVGGKPIEIVQNDQSKKLTLEELLNEAGSKIMNEKQSEAMSQFHKVTKLVDDSIDDYGGKIKNDNNTTLDASLQD